MPNTPTRPPHTWTLLPPADCPNPRRCPDCRTLNRPQTPCQWCHPAPNPTRYQPVTLPS